MNACIFCPGAFVLLNAAPAAGDYVPPADPRAGGIRDRMLIQLSKDFWPQEDVLPYVKEWGSVLDVSVSEGQGVGRAEAMFSRSAPIHDR